jgi:transposase
MWVRDRLDGLWCDEDFAAWYPRDGRPGLSPAQLATVCVQQFLLNLSDRQAAEAVRCRLDFKYALGLELDDPGFHHSVLGDFRDRLAQGGRADQLLDLALARLEAAGLVKQRGRQRTDSTHVLAAARDLTRLELVLEAVRAALEELARDAPELLDPLVTAEWAERYGRPVRLCSQPSHPIARLTEAGADAHALLALARTRAPDRSTGPPVPHQRCCDRSWCNSSSSTSAAGRGRARTRTASRRAAGRSARPMTWTPALRCAGTPGGAAACRMRRKPAIPAAPM